VFRVYDAQTGRLEVVKPGRRGELRVYSGAPVLRGFAHLGDLRFYLLPDLIRRCAARRGLLVTVVETVASGEEKVAGQLREDLADLNVHPAEQLVLEGAGPEGAGSEGLADAAAGGGFDIQTGDASVSELVGVVGLRVASGAVLFEGREMTAPEGFGVRLRDVTSRGLDPLTLRLAFLGERYRETVHLTWDTLDTAEETLLRWRDLVAGWAQSPSTAMSAHYADAVNAAFDDDLDTPVALAALHALEVDERVPDGTKFETFAAMDRILGLDLARDIGKPRPASR
jgi:cysteinyl-tRNA synthetase